LGAEAAPGVGRPGHGDDVVALFALAYRVVVHLCAQRVLVVQLARVVLETLFSQPCNETAGVRISPADVRVVGRRPVRSNFPPETAHARGPDLRDPVVYFARPPGDLPPRRDETRRDAESIRNANGEVYR